MQNNEPRKSEINLNFVVVPDDIIIDLVRERLDRPDCLTNGWILEGCPMNVY